MIAIDLRTVFVMNFVISCLCSMIMLELWRQNHARYRGLTHWVCFGVLQLGGSGAIALRGLIPDWASIVLGNGMIIGSLLLFTLGLCSFVEKRRPGLLNFALLACFVVYLAVHGYFTFVQDQLLVRLYNSAVALSLTSFAGALIAFLGVRPEIRSICRGTGVSLALYGWVNLARMVDLYLWPVESNDLFKSSALDSFLILLLVGLNALLTSSVTLMVNRRLFAEAKQSEGERQRLAAMLEATPDFAGYGDARTGQVLFINTAGRKMCGLGETEDVTQFRISDVHPPSINQLLRDQCMPTAVREGFWVGESAFLHRNGREIPVQMVLQAHRSASGEVDVFSTISRDITEAKRSAAERERLLAELARKNELAQADARIKAELLDEVNHRVKNSLTRIRSILQLKRQQFVGGAELAVLLDMQARLDAMLTVHTLLSTSLWGPLRLDKLCREVVQGELTAAHIRENMALELSFQPDACCQQMIVPGQATTLSLILNELTMNAVKYALGDRSDSRIGLQATLAPDSGVLTLTFRDNGPGWPAHVLAGQGAGVGLRLIRGAVQSLPAGRLQIFNDGGAAAVVTFRLAVP